MQPTDTRDPDYFHKVVDCQWACPAHTPVPEYIRLIAQGDFTGAYLVNRRSNVFPGILGRVCDRPCEPACRRGRVEEEPVAICRLKRVAADHRDEVSHLLPQKPDKTNGKKIALIGAGPASLTVANDLAPLGYECTIFEAHHRPGGLMIANIPAFRLPEEVLDEEIGYILNMGVELKLNSRVESLRALMEGGYDAVFVGSGAPKGKDLQIEGREEADANIHIGIDWLESVAFDHIDKIGKRVLIIGVGNTAMDCCRTSLRLGAEDVKVMARKPRQFFKASPWELEDAEDDGSAHMDEDSAAAAEPAPAAAAPSPPPPSHAPPQAPHGVQAAVDDAARGGSGASASEEQAVEHSSSQEGAAAPPEGAGPPGAKSARARGRHCERSSEDGI